MGDVRVSPDWDAVGDEAVLREVLRARRSLSKPRIEESNSVCASWVMLVVGVWRREEEPTLDSRIDSFSASLIVSTPSSSTKSRRLLGSSSTGRKAASTIVDRSTSIVDSSLAFAASRVRITFYSHRLAFYACTCLRKPITLKSFCPSL